MNVSKHAVSVGICLSVLIATSAQAKFKTDEKAIAELGKVAVISVSFKRNNTIELPASHPEYVMMDTAEARVMEIISQAGTFELTDASEVVEHPQYASLTEDSGKFHSYNYYYTHGYRKIKLSKAKKEAVALCEALGVDAVVQLYFSGYGKSSGGMMTQNNSVVMTGEVTMVDKNGKTLISGKAKSSPQHSGTTWSKGSVEISDPNKPSGFYERMFASFLGHLRQDLGFN
jgi:hypothetical protein